MNILKLLCLFVIANFISQTNFAQCINGETEVTIQFSNQGVDPYNITWDYRIGNTISGNGPYSVNEVVTTCVSVGELTILGCDNSFGSWQGAIFEVLLTEDGSINGCDKQNGCLIYRNTIADTEDFYCYNLIPEFELATINISPCDELISGCTNSKAINYNACADIDDNSCILPSENDTCEDATLIEVADLGNCLGYNVGLSNLQSNTLNLYIYSFSVLVDAFYKFVVPNSGQIKFTADKPYLDMALYNTCLEDAFYSNNSFDYQVIKNLIPGDTLILQIRDEPLGNGFSFCLEELVPTSNNTCNQAEMIDVVETGDCIWITLDNTPNTVDTIPDCLNNISSDAYYKTVVPDNGQFTFKSSARQVGLSVYSGCGGELLFCSNTAENPVIKGLNPGETVILQVFSQQIEFCLEEAPPAPNNLCDNPQPITVNKENDCEFENREEVTIKNNTLDIEPECSDNALADAFFNILVPESGHVKIETNQRIGIAVYEDCNQPALICNSSTDEIVITNLTPGETILIQTFQNWESEDFTICVSEAPPSPNNDCESAETISVNPPDVCNGFYFDVEVSIENNSINMEPACDENVQVDAFFKTIVPESGQIQLRTDNNVGLSIFNNCNEEVIYCNEDIIREDYIKDLPPGEEIILQFFRNFPSDFNFCLEDGGQAPNNDCLNALTLDLQDFCDEPSRVFNKNNTLNFTPSCNQYAEADIFYELMIPESGKIQLVVDPFRGNSTYSIGLSIYDECEETELLCKERITNKEVIEDLPPDTKAILQLFQEDPSNFDFCIRDGIPSPNNLCTNATLIEVGDCGSNIIEVNNILNNGDNMSSCSSANVDVFYKFIVPENGEVLLSRLGFYGFDAAIYDSCNGTELICDSSSNDSQFFNLPAGDMVLLRLSQRENSATRITFCLGETTPSLNNNCSDAIPVEVNAEGACNEDNYIAVIDYFNTAERLPGCFDGGITEFVDSYYEFTVPPSGLVKIYTDRLQSSFVLYRSCNGEELFCSFSNTSFDQRILKNLPVGEKVVLQFLQRRPFFPNYFCLEEITPSSNNDCENAALLPVLAEGECLTSTFTDNDLNAFNENNLLNIAPLCENSAIADIFFKFVVPENGQVDLKVSLNREDFSLYSTCNEEATYCRTFSNPFNQDVISGLTPGDTLILQIFQGIPNNFYVCLEEAISSSNDSCANAELVELRDFSPFQTFDYQYTTNNSNNKLYRRPSCNAYALADSYFEFIAPSDGQVKITSRNSGGKGFAIYDECSGTEVYCENFNSRSEIIRGLMPNEMYILQFYHDDNPSIISFNVEKAPLTTNDLCSDAIPLAILPANECVTNKTELIINNNSASLPAPCGINNADAFYKITVPESGKIYYRANDVSTYIALYKSCTGENIFCSDTESFDLLIENLTPGEELIVQLFHGFVNEFEFCISDPIINENCTTALTLNKDEIIESTLFSDFPDNSVWYKFDSGDTGSSISIHLARNECYNDNNIRLGIDLFTGDCETGLEEVSSSAIGNGQYSTSIYLSEIEPDNTYYIFIDGDNESTICNFEILLLDNLQFQNVFNPTPQPGSFNCEE